ncbi:MAG: FKBP-type peptidyl-prolyl cis-trans isomerase, partial [Gemmatimonadales bacterium]|nr:FKBP-type peptidyl-prolyl cis-trans isomerase [Gemmatimonadales bacterium]
GVLGMRVGGVRLIVIPPALGYGDAGQGPVPAGAVMVFRIELLSIS